MKNLVLSLMFTLVICSPAAAAPLSSYWDLSGATGQGLTGTTDVFSAVTYIADTTSYISATGAIVDLGHGYATGLDNGGPVGDLGLASDYEFTFSWDDLRGQIISAPITGLGVEVVLSTYFSGTFNFYIDNTVNADLGTPDARINPFDGAEDDAAGTFVDGAPVATVEVTSGYNTLTYYNGVLLNGAYNLTGTFTSLANNFWFEDTGEDLLEKYVNFEFLIGTTDGNNDPDEMRFVPGIGTYQYDNITFDYVQKIQARHDASFHLEAVPEPSTFLLLGAGLVGLGFVARRKKS